MFYSLLEIVLPFKVVEETVCSIIGTTCSLSTIGIGIEEISTGGLDVSSGVGDKTLNPSRIRISVSVTSGFLKYYVKNYPLVPIKVATRVYDTSIKQEFRIVFASDGIWIVDWKRNSENGWIPDHSCEFESTSHVLKSPEKVGCFA